MTDRGTREEREPGAERVCAFLWVPLEHRPRGDAKRRSSLCKVGVSTAIAPGDAYFLNLTDSDFACLLPFDGLKAIFSLVDSLPGFF